ncbi:MAG TPA: hypothetical protein ENH85_01175 [Candidatus Scalindua sp.]|nr:hypothetical protein [Candidatus Scalindua sp.]
MEINYSKLSIGDLVFVSGTSWISKMIKVVETGKANPEKHFPFVPSHVGVIREVFGIDGDQLAEVVFSGKRLNFSIKDYINKGSKVIVKRLNLPTAHYNQFSTRKAIEYIVDEIKVRGYDWQLITSYLIRFSIRKIWRWKKTRWISGMLDKKKMFHCAEYIARFLGWLKIEVPEFPTPWDLYRKIDAVEIDYMKKDNLK